MNVPIKTEFVPRILSASEAGVSRLAPISAALEDNDGSRYYISSTADYDIQTGTYFVMTIFGDRGYVESMCTENQGVTGHLISLETQYDQTGGKFKCTLHGHTLGNGWGMETTDVPAFVKSWECYHYIPTEGKTDGEKVKWRQDEAALGFKEKLTHYLPKIMKLHQDNVTSLKGNGVFRVFVQPAMGGSQN